MVVEIFVQVHGVTKKYKGHTALSGISLDIYKGEIFGLLGPNGAGKSTLLSIIATLVKPSSGDVKVGGISVKQSPALIRPLIGLVPQEVALYSRLSGLENLEFWGKAYGLRGAKLRDRIEQVLEVVDLKERIKDEVSSYSGGMKRRLNVAVALLHSPQLLIMDEPTVGVDVQSRHSIIKAVKQLGKEGVTVIYTSHYLDEMEAICNRLAVLQAGKLEAVGTFKEVNYTQDLRRVADE